MELSLSHRYLFLRRDSAKPIETCYPLMDGYTAGWWNPVSLKSLFHRDVASWKYAIFYSIYFFLGRNLEYKTFAIRASDGTLAHYSTVFPRYLRFPFMGNDDLQIGDLWTDPHFRGLGLAKYAVQEILRQEMQADRVYWFLVAEDNTPSIRVAQSNGFLLHGVGYRKKQLGMSLLGVYDLSENDGEESNVSFS